MCFIIIKKEASNLLSISLKKQNIAKYIYYTNYFFTISVIFEVLYKKIKTNKITFRNPRCIWKIPTKLWKFFIIQNQVQIYTYIFLYGR
jgi:hypothetical protein